MRSFITKLIHASNFDTLFSQGKDSSIGYRLFLSGGLSLNRSEQNFGGRFDVTDLESDYTGTGYLSDSGVAPYLPTSLGTITSYYGWDSNPTSAVSAPVKSVLPM